MGVAWLGVILSVVALAAVVILASEATARSDAWRRIAEERRWNWEQRQIYTNQRDLRGQRSWDDEHP